MSVDLAATSNVGLAPLSVAFDIQRYVALDIVDAPFDYDGDGVVDDSVAFPHSAQNHLYSTPGFYVAKVKIIDSDQRAVTVAVPITVLSAASR